MPPVEVYEIVDGKRVDMPTGDTQPGTGAQSDAVAAGETGVQGAPDAPPAGGQPTSDASPAQTPPVPSGEGGTDTDEGDEPLQDDSEVNAERLNKRFAYLTRKRREAERQVAQERQQHALEVAQLRGQQEATQRMLAGAAPELPQAPAQPTGPPQAEQYASHEDYVLAAARYGAQQEFAARDQQTQQERQQDQQRAFQVQLMEREQVFKTQHPDFDQVVRSGLAGKVSPVLQQALMLVPDGPAVAYALARQPDLVQRLNTMPPPLVLVELGRLSGPGSRSQPSAAQDSARSGVQGSTNGTPPTPALPAPMTPLSGAGAGAPTGSYSDSMSQREYEAWRRRTSQLPVWKER